MIALSQALVRFLRSTGAGSWECRLTQGHLRIVNGCSRGSQGPWRPHQKRGLSVSNFDSRPRKRRARDRFSAGFRSLATRESVERGQPPCPHHINGGWVADLVKKLPYLLQARIEEKTRKLSNIEYPCIFLLLDSFHFGDPQPTGLRLCQQAQHAFTPSPEFGRMTVRFFIRQRVPGVTVVHPSYSLQLRTHVRRNQPLRVYRPMLPFRSPTPGVCCS